jgi:hypothetical protein
MHIITKRKKQSKAVQMPVCLRVLVDVEVIVAATGWSRQHVYRLAQQCQIPHYRILGSVNQPNLKIKDLNRWLHFWQSFLSRYGQFFPPDG